MFDYNVGILTNHFNLQRLGPSESEELQMASFPLSTQAKSELFTVSESPELERSERSMIGDAGLVDGKSLINSDQDWENRHKALAKKLSTSSPAEAGEHASTGGGNGSSDLPVDRPEMPLRLLQGSVPERRQAAEALAALVPTQEIMKALVSAGRNDPDPEVQTQALRTMSHWCHTKGATRAGVEALLLLAGGHLTESGSFLFGNIRINVIFNNMNDDTSDRVCRIEATAQHLREVAAKELPTIEEQREAEVKALVASVPSDASYEEQLNAFTGITHTMRVLLARQLEPRFRDYLRDSSPRPVLSPSEMSQQQSKNLAVMKEVFADQVTDGIFRIGLAIKWKDSISPCYLGVLSETSPARTRYRITSCGDYRQNNEGGQTLGFVTNWHDDVKKKAMQNLQQKLDNIGLQDAAPPSQPNPLRPSKKR